MRKQLAHRIVADSEIAFGKPTIEGTHVPVEVLIGKMAGGVSAETVVEEYGVARADVLAALDYASHLISRKRMRRADSR